MNPVLTLIPAAAAAACLALLGIWWSARRSAWDGWRGLLVPLLRGLALAVLVLLAGGMALRRMGGDMRTVVVADVSAGLGADGRERAAEAAGRAREAVGRRGEFTLLAFDRQPRRVGPAQQLPASSGEGTDLEGALRAALPAFRAGDVNRLLILSDGAQTIGEAARVIPELKARGVRVLALDLAGGRPEVAVELVTAPSRVFLGQPFEVRATVAARGRDEITATLRRDGTRVDEQTVRLQGTVPGEVSFTRREREAGERRYEVSVEGEAGDYPGNNRREATVRVAGDVTVNLATADPGGSAWLAAGLRGLGMKVRTCAPQECLGPWREGRGGDVVVLDDLPASALGAAGMEVLERLVREKGTGLLVVGGRSGFGSGAWRGTMLERTLPVLMGAPEGAPERSLGLVLIIDTSMSMYFTGQGGGVVHPRTPRKIEVAKQAMLQVLAALRTGDQVGVLDSADTLVWLRRLGPLGDREGLLREVSAIGAMGGGINFYSSLLEASRDLRRSAAPVRHIMIICDSNDIDQYEVTGAGKSVDLVRALERENITLSIFAVGNPADKDISFLRTAASLGRGNFYLVSDVVYLPRYFVSDYQSKREAWLREEEFRPLVKEYAPLLAGIRTDDFPPLTGLALTTIKEGAQDILVAPFGAPVAALWKYGRGRAAVFTPDNGSRWTAAWRGWSDADLFFGQLVYATAPRPPEPKVEVWAGPAEGGGPVTFRVRRDDGSFPEAGWEEARLAGPRGSSTLPLRRTGLDAWTADLPPLEPGAWSFRLVPARDGEEPAGILEVAPPPEYRVTAAGRDVLDALVRETGGAWITDARELARDAPPRRPPLPDLTFWLALTALLSLLGELLLRY